MIINTIQTKLCTKNNIMSSESIFFTLNAVSYSARTLNNQLNHRPKHRKSFLFFFEFSLSLSVLFLLPFSTNNKALKICGNLIIFFFFFKSRLSYEFAPVFFIMFFNTNSFNRNFPRGVWKCVVAKCFCFHSFAFSFEYSS